MKIDIDYAGSAKMAQRWYGQAGIVWFVFLFVAVMVGSHECVGVLPE